MNILRSPSVQAAIVTLVVAVATYFKTDLSVEQVAPIVATIVAAFGFVFTRVSPVPKAERGFTVQTSHEPSEDGF